MTRKAEFFYWNAKSVKEKGEQLRCFYLLGFSVKDKHLQHF